MNMKMHIHKYVYVMWRMWCIFNMNRVYAENIREGSLWDSFICNKCEMTHLYGTWLIHMGHGSFIRDMSFICDMTWRIHVGHGLFIWDMTHSCGTWLMHVRHDSLMCHMCEMTHSYGTWYIHMGHDAFMWDMTHACKTWHTHV